MGHTGPFPFHREELLALGILEVVAPGNGKVLGSDAKEKVPLGVPDLLATTQRGNYAFDVKNIGTIDSLDVEIIASE